MKIFEYAGLDERCGFPFAPQPEEGMTRFFNGTSAHFRERIETQGLRIDYRLVTATQYNVIELYAGKMPNLGPDGVWGLSLKKRLNLAELCGLAVNYASTLKGGAARNLHDDLCVLIDDHSASVAPDHLLVFEALRDGLAPV